MMCKILSSVVMILAVASSTSVEATVTNSWDLSHDMMSGITTNPFGVGNVWTAMYDTQGTSHTPDNYEPMPTYYQSIMGNPYSVWTGPSQGGVGVATQTYVFGNETSHLTHVQGIPTLHPGTTSSSIVRWQSPINGNVDIMGRITDVDAACGDGITWFIDKGGLTLTSGTLVSSSNTVLQQNIPVSVGTALYFIVSPNRDYFCDTTYLEVCIGRKEKWKCIFDDAQLVDLISFNATHLSSGRVSFEWRTASEHDNAGFNIWRAQLENDDLAHITKVNRQLIPSKSVLGWAGASYSAEDTKVTSGNTYYYVLEDFNNAGESTLHCNGISAVNIDSLMDTGSIEKVKQICREYAGNE